MRPSEAVSLPVCVEPDLNPKQASLRTESFVQRLVDETVMGNPVAGVVLRACVSRLLAKEPGRDQTFVGNDASAGVVVAVADALVWSRQLQEEVVQCQLDAIGSVDPRAMVALLDVIGSLQVLLRQAVEVHARLHAAEKD